MKCCSRRHLGLDRIQSPVGRGAPVPIAVWMGKCSCKWHSCVPYPQRSTSSPSDALRTRETYLTTITMTRPNIQPKLYNPPTSLLEPLQLLQRNLPLPLTKRRHTSPLQINLWNDLLPLRMIPRCKERFLPPAERAISAFRREGGRAYRETQRHQRQPSVRPSNPGRGVIRSLPIPTLNHL